ncbi:tripartite tricarboxylate transporter TctB family protein [Microbacterium sp. NIBRBAC000506063]|uniref:tripartite tricarboxylate transporter TctB family protein n=1 Tax=Microbacterium sp. NIBRBAC000506063 TaxID=2734618 RepID=UPI001BB4FCCD|nr:tripartite tricarboxylate transporter TctB family protein [Microbacterium sp. NIBRBAC000506063]QTV80295.1 tripartite tricarboxylate transporter TctB family protein [Microbacterium sp. NIBRBAC000506063]
MTSDPLTDIVATPTSRVRASRAREVGIAAGVAVLAGGVLVATQSLPDASGGDTFGPRWWPSLLAVTTLLLSGAMIVLAIVKPSFSDEASVTGNGVLRLLGAIGLIIIYGIVWNFVHFIPVTLVLASALTALQGGRGWRALLLFPAVITGVLYVLFGVLLRVPL